MAMIKLKCVLYWCDTPDKQEDNCLQSASGPTIFVQFESYLEILFGCLFGYFVWKLQLEISFGSFVWKFRFDVPFGNFVGTFILEILFGCFFGYFVWKFRLEILFWSLDRKFRLEILFGRQTDRPTNRQSDFLKLLAGA